MAFVGEAVLSAFIDTLFDKLASSDLLQFARQEEVFADIKKWEKTLRKLHAVLDDAEEKQLTSRLVKLWLDDLRDLAYDVEDILDDFATEALGQKLIMAETQASSTSSKVRRLFPSWCTTFTPTAIKFNRKMRSKIQKISSRLQDISAQKNDLHLAEYTVAGRTTTARAIPGTTCSVDESSVCGRETDIAAILKLLFHDHEPINVSDDADAVHVIAIIAMGGMGKTTLAQLAYNHEKAQSHFDLRVWVCVSDDFDVLRVTRTILQSVSSDVKNLNQLDLNQLQLELKEQLSGKKFLLVLDDVWNENRRVWETFYNPILRSGGAQAGSRVIVTTRNQGVVSAIGACSAYPLKHLPNDECLSLLAQQALGKRNFDNHPDLRVVGEEIAKKCKGLPLAAKTLGGMLSTTQNPDAWEHILNSKIWELPDQENNDILPALKLSYHHLPSHLKRCFAYCSIFPKDYEFKVDELVLLWMGEGFLDKVRGRKQMEEIGTEFFHQLLARSFFQQSDSKASLFVMHDLVHDLAQFVAGDTCFNLEDKLENNEQPHTISERARHSSFIRQRYAIARKFEAFGEVKTNLRTLISLPSNIHPWWEMGYISQKVLHDLLMRMGCLRVLSLVDYRIREVPDLIGELKHLRYLNFSKCSIERLPDSLGDLYNLQTLKLRNCYALSTLPKGIKKLINLRHFDITGTTIQGMPFQVGNLTNLQTLSRFIVSKRGGSRLGELKNLSNLQGVLSISKLQKIVKVEDANDANLKNKQKLNELIMGWNDVFWDSRNDGDELQVMESLQPHENLERLTVAFYGGSKFPCWVGDPSFSKMVSVTLRGCKKCTSLPTLGGLPSLEVLHVQGMENVESIGAEFYGECMNPFASLKELRFEDMPEWESWSHDSNLIKDSITAFPALEKFEIRKCPNLMGELPKWLQSLVKLEVSKCPRLVCELPPKLASVNELNLQECDEVMWSGDEEEVDLRSLATLKLRRISNLNGLRTSQARSMVALKELVIENCGGLTCLWEEEEEEEGQQGALLGNLKILRIKGCLELEKLWNGLQSAMRLEKLEIEDCPKLESFLETEFPPMLRHLLLRNCRNLKALPLPQNYNNSVCALESLVISDCSNLKSFPTTAPTGTGELVLPSTLKRLEICNCTDLESMSMSMSGNMCPNNTTLECLHFLLYPNLITLPEGLNGLKELYISCCQGLECFPARGLSTPNLTILHIYGCENLKSLPHQMRNLKSLRELRISSCPGLESFPEGGLAPNLASLWVTNCENLKSHVTEWGLQSLTSLSSLTIEDVSLDMVSFPEDKFVLPSSLLSLTVGGMASLTSLPLPKLNSITTLKVKRMKSLTSLPLPKLDSLTSLNVEDMESLASLSLPKLHSLTSLEVRNIESLASLPLQNLTSLQSLNISYCPKLRSLGSLPSTLEKFAILHCPIIAKRCLKGKGEYFPNIAYIPLLMIDAKCIHGLTYNERKCKCIL